VRIIEPPRTFPEAMSILWALVVFTAKEAATLLYDLKPHLNRPLTALNAIFSLLSIASSVLFLVTFLRCDIRCSFKKIATLFKKPRKPPYCEAMRELRAANYARMVQNTSAEAENAHSTQRTLLHKALKKLRELKEFKLAPPHKERARKIALLGSCFFLLLGLFAVLSRVAISILASSSNLFIPFGISTPGDFLYQGSARAPGAFADPPSTFLESFGLLLSFNFSVLMLGLCVAFFEAWIGYFNSHSLDEMEKKKAVVEINKRAVVCVIFKIFVFLAFLATQSPAVFILEGFLFIAHRKKLFYELLVKLRGKKKVEKSVRRYGLYDGEVYSVQLKIQRLIKVAGMLCMSLLGVFLLINVLHFRNMLGDPFYTVSIFNKMLILPERPVTAVAVKQSQLA